MSERLELEIILDNGQFKVNAKESERSIKGLGSTVDRAGKQGAKGFKGLSDGAGMLKTAMKGIVGLAVVKSLYDIGKAALKTSADLESQSVAFETMLGSAEAAQGLMEQIKEFSASTPFQLPQLNEASAKLISFGVSHDEVIDKMRMLGDASMGNSQSLETLADVYGKVKVSGRASMEDINRVADRGVAIYESLAETMGINESQVRKFVETGKVGFSQVDAAFKQMTSEGGKYFGMMAKSSQTLNGQLSTLKDRFVLIADSMGDEMSPAFKNLIEAMNLTNESGGALATLFVKIGQGISIVVNKIAWFVAGIQELVIAVQKLNLEWEKRGEAAMDGQRQLEIEKEILELNNKQEDIAHKRASYAADMSESMDKLVSLEGSVTKEKKDQLDIQKRASKLTDSAPGVNPADLGGSSNSDISKSVEEWGKLSAQHLQTERERLDSWYQYQSDKLMQWHESEPEKLNEYNQYKEALFAEHQERLTGIEERETAKRRQIAQTVLGTAQTVTSSLGQMFGNLSKAKINNLDEEYNAQQQYFSDYLDASGATEEEKNAILEKLKEQHDRAVLQIQRRQAQRQKVIGSVETAINTASAVMRAFATLGPIGGAIAMPFLIGLGATQIALIASQPLPSYAVGTPEVPQDMVAQIHKGEMIVPAPMADSVRRGDLSLSGGSEDSTQIIEVHNHVEADGLTLVEFVNRFRGRLAQSSGMNDFSTQGVY
jgi:tape measure domain-containing protein